MRKGDAYAFELAQEGRKKIVKMQKVLELGYEVASIEVYPEKNMIFAVSSTGIISSYSADTVELNVFFVTKHRNTQSQLWIKYLLLRQLSSKLAKILPK
jgi:hypothetical protein